MRTLVSAAMLALLTLSAVLAAAPAALAKETRCVGTIGARTVDNLRVPQGRSCTLEGTCVQGAILVERDATLRATQVRVIGNVQAEGHRFVSLGNSVVGGSVQFDQGGAFRVGAARITGALQVVSNNGESRLNANTVNADIQVFSHTGGIAITDNRVDGNLQCKENAPRPTGGGNVVQGNKEDQCARL